MPAGSFRPGGPNLAAVSRIGPSPAANAIGTTTTSPSRPGPSPTASSSPRPARRATGPSTASSGPPSTTRRGGSASTAGASSRAPGQWRSPSPPSSSPGARRRRRTRARRPAPAAGATTRRPPGGRGGLRAGPDGVGVRLRRAHAPRDSGRPLGAERARDGLARALHAPGGLHRCGPARLRRPGDLSARPLPGQRHDGRRAHRRPELGPVDRPDPVPRGPEHPADHRRAHRRRRAPAPGGEHRRPQRGSAGCHPRRDVERGGAGAAGGLQGVHRLEPDGSGLLARGPRHRPPHRPARARPRREGLRGPQGPAAGELRPGLQPPRRHGGGLAPVPRHAIRRLPRRLGPLARRGALRPERDHRHRHAAGLARPPRRATERQRLGRRGLDCGASS